MHEAVGKWIIIGLVLLFAVAAAMTVVFSMHGKVRVYIGDTAVQARVASEPAQRTKGLSGTKHLAEGEGMLFVFESSKLWSMWMKDMRYNLDIMWLDETKKVVDIAHDVSPDSYPQSFTPQSPARYVLEVPGGFADKHGVAVGVQASFRDDGSW